MKVDFTMVESPQDLCQGLCWQAAEALQKKHRFEHNLMLEPLGGGPASLR
jgi:hypothetical protein